MRGPWQDGASELGRLQYPIPPFSQQIIQIDTPHGQGSQFESNHHHPYRARRVGFEPTHAVDALFHKKSAIPG